MACGWTGMLWLGSRAWHCLWLIVAYLHLSAINLWNRAGVALEAVTGCTASKVNGQPWTRRFDSGAVGSHNLASSGAHLPFSRKEDNDDDDAKGGRKEGKGREEVREGVLVGRKKERETKRKEEEQEEERKETATDDWGQGKG